MINRANLKLVSSSDSSEPHQFSLTEMAHDHQLLLDSFIRSQDTRNLSARTIEGDRRFLTAWFRSHSVADPRAIGGTRPLTIMDVMAVKIGRTYVDAYLDELIDREISPSTWRQNVGRLRRLFEHIEKEPYIPGPGYAPIERKYGPIVQPIREYDYPVHGSDRPSIDLVLDDDRLIQLYNFVRLHYIPRHPHPLIAQRNYTMLVSGGTMGPRADEIRCLDGRGPTRELFYDHKFVRIRFGKGANGSGKRERTTIFTPFAQATLRVYEQEVRPRFANAETEPAPFLTERGGRMSYQDLWHALRSISDAAIAAGIIGPAVRSAGYEVPLRLRWHDLRRSFATNFLLTYPNRIIELMHWMGHSDLNMLIRYIRPNPSAWERIRHEVFMHM